MPKYDHQAIGESFIAKPPTERGKALTRTQSWLSEASNVEELLEAVACGDSLRRLCVRHQLAYAPVQRFLASPAMRDRYHTAQAEQTEHLMGEIARIQRELEGRDEDGELKYRDVKVVARDGTERTEQVVDAMDPKIGAVILDSLKWRISKLNPARYSDRQVLEQHTFDHTKAHIDAVRQLARQPRPELVGRDVTPRLTSQPVQQADRVLLDVQERPEEVIDVLYEQVEPAR